MANSNIYKNQIQNRNFLTPVGFKFILNRAPKVAFFSNQANIPGIDLGSAIQPTYLKDLDTPGDKLSFNDLTITFLVDEDLENYMEIQHWMRGLGYPESLQEIYNLQKEDTFVNTTDSKLMNIYSDGMMNIYTSSQNVNFMVKYRDLFPVSLSDLQFDATNQDIQYFTAEATFKYTIYDIVDKNGDSL
jgi:hypothetical protein